MHLDDVARGARLLRHDGHVALGERIQQRRLAGIGRSGDDDAEAVAQALAARGRRDGARSRRASFATMASALTATSVATSPSSAKSSPASTSACAREQLRRASPRRACRSDAFRLRQRLTPLRLGLGIDEIGEALDLGEIELAVLEGAARELAGLGEPHAGERRAAHRSRARITARLPCSCSSAMSSPVKLAGPGNHSTRPRSSTDAAADPMSRKARMARRGHAAAQCASSAARVPAPTRGSPRWRRGPAPLASAHDGVVRWHGCWAPLRYPRAQRKEGPCRSASKVTGLRRETSPYLLQHKDNPVHWWAWGAGGARRGQARPASRSCSRSATPPATGATSWRMRASRTRRPRRVMNELFVNIKVDREERPDVDAIYMARAARARRAGRLAAHHVPHPRRRAVLGRHLFPARTRATAGRPSSQVLKEIARIYRDEPDKVAAERRRAEGRGCKPRAERDAATRRRPMRCSPISRGRLVQRGRSGAWRHQGRAEISASRSSSSCCGAPGCATALRQSARGGRRSR